MGINIIFLDIDGVLSTIEGPEPKTYEETLIFVPECLENFKILIEKTNAEIVISSVWRKSRRNNTIKWQYLTKQLEHIKLPIDITPYNFELEDGTWSRRGNEIQRWLDENKHLDIDKFIILDDDSDMEHLMPYLVHTCNRHGFQPEHLKQALDMFGVS